jgi:hypothetical protein
MLAEFNTEKGRLQIQAKDLFYACVDAPPVPSSRVMFHWLEAKNLEEAQNNTAWLLTQLGKIPTLLPL